jgi:CRISPR/Cas system-associated exonuclease Cas4 (RecB family)
MKASIELGSWMDFVLNEAMAYKRENGVSRPFTEILEIADREWQRRIEPLPVWDLKKVTKPEARIRLTKALGEYHETWGERLKPLMIQEPLIVPEGVVGPRQVYGVPDLVTEDGWIVDHKTKGKGFYPSAENGEDVDMAKAKALLSRDLQLGLYAMGYYAKFQKPPVGIRLIGLVYTKKPEVQVVEVVPTAEMVRWVQAASRRAAEVIEAGKYLPNPSAPFCSTCEYSDACTERFGRAPTGKSAEETA